MVGSCDLVFGSFLVIFSLNKKGRKGEMYYLLLKNAQKDCFHSHVLVPGFSFLRATSGFNGN